MNDVKEMVLFFSCDEWKSLDSMRFIAVADCEHEREVWEGIKRDWNYTDEEMEKYIYTEYSPLNQW